MDQEHGIVFACVDPLGRYVELREDTWYDHILQEHAEMVGQEGSVEWTVTRPNAIKIDADDHARRVFYAFNLPAPPFYGRHLKVVVEFAGTERERMVNGEVVTAFAVVRPKRQEKHEW